MCRMFGFRSKVPRPVDHSLLRGANALRFQSQDHPDGWGIGYYPPFPSDAPEGQPQVDRGLYAAFADEAFARAAGRVSARAVVAHVRRASCGPVSLANTHPFQRGRWLFAHNGTVAGFAEEPGCRAALEAEIDPALRRGLAGDTDSERCFLLFLSRIQSRTPLQGAAPPEDIAWALSETVRTVRALADRPGVDPSSLTFIVSDGATLLALRHGRSLHLCAGPATGATVEHFTVASEVIGEGECWREVPEGGFAGVGPDLRLLSL